jgi:purine nucleoside permease
MSFRKPAQIAAAALSLTVAATSPASADDPVKVKVFIGSMFEIGQNTGDRAGEFQHW